MAIAIEETANGVLYQVMGTVTGQQLLESVEMIGSSGEKAQRWLFCLKDFTGVDTLQCSAEEIQALADRDHHLLASMVPKGFVVAVVTANDSQFGLARMWETCAEATGWETAVFRSRSDAERWIRNSVRAKFRVEAQILPEAKIFRV